MNHQTHRVLSGGWSFRIGSRTLSRIAFLIASIAIVALFGFRNIIIADSIDDIWYVRYGLYAPQYFNLMVDGILASAPGLLLEEPLYAGFNYVVYVTFGPEHYFPVFISFALGVLSLALFRVTRQPLLCLLAFMLFTPVAKNWYVHLRQGLAISVFLLILSLPKARRALLQWLPAFIHTSFFVSAATQVYASILGRFPKLYRIRVPIFAVFSIVFAAVLPTALTILGYSAERRSYDATGAAASIYTYTAYIVFGLVLVLISRGNPVQSAYVEQYIYGLVLYITLGQTVPYAARIFENYIPLGLIAVFQTEPIPEDASPKRRDQSLFQRVGLVIVLIAMMSYLLPGHPVRQFGLVPFGFNVDMVRDIATYY